MFEDLALKAKLNLDSCFGEDSDSCLEGGGIFVSFSLWSSTCKFFEGRKGLSSSLG